MNLLGDANIFIVLFAPMAYTTVFQVECTFPEGNPTYVSGPNVRSTLSILSSAISAIIFRTWMVLHLSLPANQKALRKGFRTWAQRLWQTLWRKLKWTLVALIMPGFVVGKALGDCVAAYRSARCSVMQSHAKRSRTSWTMTHAFFANMGGYILHQGDLHTTSSADALVSYHYRCGCVATNPLKAAERTPEHSPCRRCRHRQSKGTSERDSLSSAGPPPELPPELPSQLPRKTRSYCCCSRASQSDFPSIPSSNQSTVSRIFDSLRSDQHWWLEEVPSTVRYADEDRRFGPPFAINSAQLCVLMSKGLITQLPDISEDEIKDKSKEDMLVKLLTLGQIGWIIVDLIARKASRLSSTLLELAGLNFSICAILTYSLLLEKPKDVKEPIKVLLARQLDDDDKDQLLWLNATGFFRNALCQNRTITPKQTIANDMYNAEARLGLLKLRMPWHVTSEDIGYGLGTVISGTVYCLAWNFTFLTSAEQIVWRSASVYTAAIFPVYYFTMLSHSWLSHDSRLWHAVRRVIANATYLSYAICRLFMIVDAFRSLAYLPPDAFLTTRSDLITYLRR